MRAAVVIAGDAPLEVWEDVEAPLPVAGEIRVRVAACGICGSDLTAIRRGVGGGPFVCGHEAAGVVTEVGPGVRQPVEGDHVVLAFVAPCGRCPECAAGRSNLCRADLLAPGPTRLSRAGSPLSTISLGAYTEEIVVPAAAAVPVDRDLPLELAALIGCGVLTGVGAATTTAELRPGEAVAVLGVGGVGVNVVQGARIAGAATIVAVDPNPTRREFSLRVGATHAVGPEEFAGLTNDLTRGVGWDAVFEVSGREDSLRPGLERTRRGGRMVLVGLSDARLPVTVRELALMERRLLGSFYGSARIQLDVPRMVALWRAGRLDLESLATRRIALDEVNEGLDATRRGEGIRTLITFP